LSKASAKFNVGKVATETINSTHANNEIRIQARAVSRGVAIGKVVCLHGKKRQFYRVNLTKTQIEKELRRFRASVRLAKRQIKQLGESESKTQTNIFDTHLLILEDTSFLNKIETTISEQLINAEWAVKLITDNYLSLYKDFTDLHLRERQIDISDVSERILAALGGGGKVVFSLDDNSIIVAKEVKPSTVIELSQSNLQGIVVENGGWTSHTFILAREHKFPAVTGVKSILQRFQTGDSIIVDGYNGQIIINPTAETSEHYAAAQAKFQQVQDSNFEPAKGRLKTLDGKEIIIRANLDYAANYAEAKKLGAEGIGLYRSEFLFNQNQSFPTELEQIEAYRQIAKTVADDGVKIRTFDVGIEQVTGENENNPALGLKAIRLSLDYKKVFRTQIRAILQASFEHKIDITLPMISDISEIIKAKKIIESERKFLQKKGVKIGNTRLGAMIEVPSAVFMIEEIAREVDFLCLGTNDLVQYLLAVDRDNESVADYFRTLHPAVLRAIKQIFKAAESVGIPAIVCGEMSGSPLYAAILVGLGADELSMPASSMRRLRATISRIAFEEAREIANELLNCRTANEVEMLVSQRFSTKWSHVFPPETLPNLKSKKG
jgi:phosphoenolpyruvate-protein phosphotransferase (PTS system enzyme I)